MAITVHNLTIDGTQPPRGVTNWNSNRYEQMVRRLLIRVFTSAVGGPLVAQIANSRHSIRIVPNPDRERDANDVTGNHLGTQWDGVTHIHLAGAGRGGHVPVDPGVRPR